MPKHYPDRVDPWPLVEREHTIQGKFALTSMSRLSELLCADGRVGEEQADFSLSFYRNEARRSIIRCEIRATLDLICQRCLGSMRMEMEIDSMLALVQGAAEAEMLPAELEPLMLAEDGLLQISELLEDELLLALPDVPKHSEEDCLLSVDDATEAHLSENTEQAEPNPFDVLAVLKDSNKENI